MKSGASDPFADDEPADESQPEAETESETADSGADEQGSEPDAPSDDEAESTPTISKADLPLLLRRDTVKAERENVHQLFVQDDTDTKARNAENELSQRLDTDVYRLDAREAIYLAGMKNLADAEEILEDWGYNF